MISRTYTCKIQTTSCLFSFRVFFKKYIYNIKQDRETVQDRTAEEEVDNGAGDEQRLWSRATIEGQ